MSLKSYYWADKNKRQD